MEKTYVTKEGFDSLNKRYRELIDVIKPQVLEELKEARAQGDLSENADYDAARAKQAEVEGEIKELKEKIENAVIIDDGVSSSSVVKIGSYVVLHLSYNNQDVEYQIVGTTEADPKKFKISNECALAKAVIGKKVGQTVQVKANKAYDVKILSTSAKSAK